MIEGNENIPPGTVVEGDVYGQSHRQLQGIYLHFDATDESVLVTHPRTEPNSSDNEWDVSWLQAGTIIDISNSPEGRALRVQFPLDPLAPGYIFMVIRPSRKISTYANLDSLMAGAVKDISPANDEPVLAEAQLRACAAQAISDPEVDVRLPGRKNGYYLRFTQVEGA